MYAPIRVTGAVLVGYIERDGMTVISIASQRVGDISTDIKVLWCKHNVRPIGHQGGFQSIGELQ